MHRVEIDSAMSEFLSHLPLDDDGVELEYQGRIVCELFPPQINAEIQRQARQTILELMAKTQKLNKNVPKRVIERDIREAISEVRGRDQR